MAKCINLLTFDLHMAGNMLEATNSAHIDSAAVTDLHTAHVGAHLPHGPVPFPLSSVTYDVLYGRTLASQFKALKAGIMSSGHHFHVFHVLGGPNSSPVTTESVVNSVATAAEM